MEGIIASLAFIVLYVLIILGTYLTENNSTRVKLFRLVVVFSSLNACLNICEARLGSDALSADFSQVAFIHTLEVVVATGSFISLINYVGTLLKEKTRLFILLKWVFIGINIVLAVTLVINLFVPLPFLDSENGTRLPDASEFYKLGIVLVLLLYLFIIIISYKQLSRMLLFCFWAFALCALIDPVISVNQYSYLFGIGQFMAVVICSFFAQIKRKNDYSISKGHELDIKTAVIAKQEEIKKSFRKKTIFMWLSMVAMIMLTALITIFGRINEESEAGFGSAVPGMITVIIVMTGIYMIIVDYKIGVKYSLIGLGVTVVSSALALLGGGQVNAFAGLMQAISGILAVLLIYTYLKSSDQENEIIISQAIRTFAEMIDSRDSYTGGHSVRVSEYSGLIAERMGYDEENVTRVKKIGLLHDCGKLGIDDDILNKNGKLTAEEYEVIKSHTTLGANMLVNFDFIEGMNAGAKYHHERYDGNGYPQGLAGNEIPEIGRIIAVADAFDAMNSRRCYREALSKEHILRELRNNMGTQFDPKIAEIMIELIENEIVL